MGVTPHIVRLPRHDQRPYGGNPKKIITPIRSKVNEVKVKGQRLKGNECKLGS